MPIVSAVISVTDILDGTDGTDGNTAGLIVIYRKASSIPATPADSTDFSVSDLSFTAPTNWSKTIPSGTDPLYISTATFDQSTTTLDWTAPIKFEGEDGTDGMNGNDGATGPRSASRRIWSLNQSANAPTLPTNTNASYSFTNGTFTGNSFNNTNGPWTNVSPTEDASSANPYWTSDTTSVEANFGGNVNSNFATARKNVVFTGIVTFTNANQISDGTDTQSFGNLASSNQDLNNISTYATNANVGNNIITNTSINNNTNIDGGRINTGQILGGNVDYNNTNDAWTGSGFYMTVATDGDLSTGAMFVGNSTNQFLAFDGSNGFQFNGSVNFSNQVNATTNVTQLGNNNTNIRNTIGAGTGNGNSNLNNANVSINVANQTNGDLNLTNQSDATTTGLGVVKANTAANARNSIGAGTGNGNGNSNLTNANVSINAASVNDFTGTVQNTNINGGFINTGVVAGGNLTINSTNFEPNAGQGFALGTSSGTGRFVVGSSTEYMWWDGSTLRIQGEISNVTESLLRGEGLPSGASYEFNSNTELGGALTGIFGAGVYVAILWGGGGGGGAGTNNADNSGSARGGGSGGMAICAFEYDGTSTLNASLGSGGAGGSSGRDYVTGGAGGASNLTLGGTVIMTANGGSAGGGTNNTRPGGTGVVNIANNNALFSAANTNTSKGSARNNNVSAGPGVVIPTIEDADSNLTAQTASQNGGCTGGSMIGNSNGTNSNSNNVQTFTPNYVNGYTAVPQIAGSPAGLGGTGYETTGSGPNGGAGGRFAGGGSQRSQFGSGNAHYTSGSGNRGGGGAGCRTGRNNTNPSTSGGAGGAGGLIIARL